MTFRCVTIGVSVTMKSQFKVNVSDIIYKKREHRHLPSHRHTVNGGVF